MPVFRQGIRACILVLPPGNVLRSSLFYMTPCLLVVTHRFTYAILPDQIFAIVAMFSLLGISILCLVMNTISIPLDTGKDLMAKKLEYVYSLDSTRRTTFLGLGPVLQYIRTARQSHQCRRGLMSSSFSSSLVSQLLASIQPALEGR